MEKNQAFWLADWQVKPDLGVLENTAGRIQLEPKVMSVLQLLASRPGEVFSRQELEEKVWQDTVVGYDALAKAINKLREALGDDKKAPRFIQTIPKKGYRLVAEVRLASPDKIDPVKMQPAIAMHSGRPWLILSAGLLVLVVAGLFAIYMPGRQEAVDTPATSLTATKTKPTIVVLPFRNISQSNQDDYLADGLTSDLTTNLSRLSSLWVTASSATLAYKNTDISDEKIKLAFNARYVISGEVNKSGEAIRINVRLADVDNGTILWADRYDRQFTDLFVIQDEVTRRIVDSLSLALTKEEKLRIAKRYTNNIEAYEVFLRAQFLLNVRTAEDNIQARELLRKAIDIDPVFARAYASLSYSYAIGYLRQWPADTNKPLERALQLAEQALALDDDLPESYWAAAFVYFYYENLEKGTELLKKALQLNPNYADAYALLGANYISQGRIQDALDIMAKAYRLNPAGGYLYDMQLGRSYYFMGNYESALQYFTGAMDKNPTFIDLQLYTAATYVRLGRLDDAAWMIYEAKQHNPDFDPHSWAKAYPYLDNKGFREKLLKDIDKAEEYSRSH